MSTQENRLRAIEAEAQKRVSPTITEIVRFYELDNVTVRKELRRQVPRPPDFPPDEDTLLLEVVYERSPMLNAAARRWN